MPLSERKGRWIAAWRAARAAWRGELSPAETARIRNEAILNGVVECIPCGLSVWNGKQELVAANQLYRRFLDLPDELFANSRITFAELVEYNFRKGEYGEGDAARVTRERLLRFADRPGETVIERQRPNGMTIEIRGAAMPDGGFIFTMLDLSDRRRFEAEVLRSERLLRSAMEAINEAFVLFDPDDRLVFCNDKFRSDCAEVADILKAGVSFEHVIRERVSRSPDHVAHRHSQGPEAWISARLAQHRGGNTTEQLRSESGSDNRWLRLIERRLPDGHTAGFRFDITDLVNATEAAQKASRAKGQFLANMSHEIRTPMNAVLGMLKLLQKTALSPRQQDYVGKAEGAARSLLGLLNDILDFSKVEAGKMTLDPHPMRIDELLRELSVILAASVGRKNVEVLFDVDPKMPRCVVADAMRLQQVLINLAGNAIKFTEAGEVVLQLRMLERDEHNVELLFTVRDTGIGIAPEHQRRIFTGFNQAEASTTRRFGGTGLGLAISQRLVQMMGGELMLESALGKGSSFSFRLHLPLHEPAAAHAGASGASGAAPTQGLRALLVDDNAAARMMLGAMAQSLGWHVDTADSGVTALQRVRDAMQAGNPYEVVLVDWVMPGMDGWQTSRELRALSGSSGTGTPVVVMVTAHGREMLAQRNEQEQNLLDGFLVKPVTASMLHDAVADARAGLREIVPAPPSGRDEPASHRLAGLRLLVVEDNPNNQQVARELLEAEGAAVLLAGDGQQGLSLLAQSKNRPPHIDAVLMDVQMPVMDGYTATRLIRRQLFMTLPIIAMTANAMASDRQACLDVGMSEHVGKPFDIDHVVAVLRRHCGLSVAGAVPAPRAAAQPVPADLLARARDSGIELGEALGRLSGNVELFLHMAEALSDAAKALSDPPDQQGLHGLRGVAAQLGARGLAALAQEGETALHGGLTLSADWLERWAFLLAQQLAALGTLAAQLQLHVVPDSSAGAGCADTEIAPQLQELIDLLEGSDMAALDRHAPLRTTLRAQWPATAEALEASLAGLDFASAAGHCRSLLREAPLASLEGREIAA
ncbi:MAG TPA: response regulator [Burkholderiaceae bacterium]|jgi:signal transduction histidine kinase/CheY-like chemotaxis protein